MLERKDIQLTVNEQAIRGTLSCTKVYQGTPTVLFAHGLGSTRHGEKAAALETECTRRGWSFAAFDFHGHGASDGTMLEMRGARLIADLEAITNYLHERGHESLFLVGSSMGGWASAWFAALHPQHVQACALIAPSFRFLEWRRLNETARLKAQQTGRLTITNEWIDLQLNAELLTEAERFTFDDLLTRWQTPSLIMHGMLDDVVPYSDSIDFIQRCAGTETQLLLIKDGDHRLNVHKKEIARLACDFFAQYFPPSA